MKTNTLMMLATVALGIILSPSSGKAQAGRQQLGIDILNNGKISLYTGFGTSASNSRQNIVDTSECRAATTDSGARPWLHTGMLQAMKSLATTYGYSFRVTTIAGGQHMTGSRHYAGCAFDVDLINGVRVSAGSAHWQTFLSRARAMGATETLGPGNAGHDTHIHMGWPTGTTASSPGGCNVIPPPPEFVASAAPRMKGDFNFDGKEDVAIAYDYGAGRTALFVGLSTGISFNTVKWWESTGGWEANRSQWVAGDFNFDGKTDVAALYNYGGSSSKLWVFLSTGAGFSPGAIWWSAASGWEANRSKMVAGDFNADGRHDIVIAYDYGNTSTAMFAFLSTGTSFNGVEWWRAASGWEAPRSKWVSGDFNADGKCDVAALYNYGNADSALFMFASSGTSFAGGVQWWRSGAGNFEWSRAKIFGGKFNSDTRSDVGIAYDYGAQSAGLLTYLSTGTSFTGGTWWQALSGWEPARSQWVAGDFDQDGLTDVTAMYNYGNSDSALFMFRSTGSSFPGGTQWWRSGAGNWDWARSTAF